MSPDVTSESSATERKQLLEAELARYLRLLSGAAAPDRIILFGSLASGRVHSHSDIDLVIVQRTRLPFWERLRAMRRLLQPSVGTDLLVYTPEEIEKLRRQRPFFREQVLGKGRVIYERGR